VLLDSRQISREGLQHRSETLLFQVEHQ
jgi:hypothetical protein